MEALLKFDLPEEHDEYRCAINGGKYLAALQELDNAFREKIKYAPDDIPVHRLDAYIEARDMLHNCCEDFCIWS